MKIFEIPNGHEMVKKIDLAKNIKVAIFVNVVSLLLAFIVFCIGFWVSPIDINFVDLEQPFKPLLIYGILMVILIGYMVLHELVQGIFIKKYSGEKAKYGFNGLYAFAKSEAFFNKKEYIIIALSPIVFFGILCLALNMILGQTLFWYIYAVQILNISGAAGDLYVSFVLRKFSNDILIKDDGVSMSVYDKLTKD